MKLEVITLEERKRWDDIISSFALADVYYLSGYARGFNLHGDGEPLLFYFLEEHCGSRAINIAMKRDIARDSHFIGKLEQNKCFDLVTPYGYGGLLCEGTESFTEFANKINAKYAEYCIKNNIVSEFVRFHPNIGNAADAQKIYDIVLCGETICIDLHDKEAIWNNIISKNRNVIRKAQKLGVKINHGMSLELIKQFVTLYNATMDRDNAAKYYYFENEFYQSIMEDLNDNATIFYAIWENKIVSASIVLFGNGRMHYHLSASDAEYRNLASSNLLLYEAACWGADNGYKTFHLGGGLGSKPDSLFKFKKAFNRLENTKFYIGRKVFNNDAYEKLLAIRKQKNDFDEGTSFFPKYRG